MNLKEAFRYQNKLQSFLDEAQRMLDRDDTHACLCCDQTLAGHFRSQRVNTADDVAPQLVIEL